jgi:hypothetical protein
MTTVVAERTEWDTFLIEDVERQHKLPEHREAALLSRRRHIEGFRVTQWRSIKDQLQRKYLWVLLVEPHWTAPGAAVFWQRQTVRVRGRGPDGRPAIIEEETGWAPTAPFPANNASQIAQRLEKGLLLRCPDEGTSVEKLQHAEPAVAVQDEVEPDQFFCDRHGGDFYGFKTWKAYCVHCVHWREDIDKKQLPANFEMGEHHWYCFLHRVGWKKNNERGALQHLVKHPRMRGERMDLTVLEISEPPKMEVVSLEEARGGVHNEGGSRSGKRVAETTSV